MKIDRIALLLIALAAAYPVALLAFGSSSRQSIYVSIFVDLIVVVSLLAVLTKQAYLTRRWIITALTSILTGDLYLKELTRNSNTLLTTFMGFCFATQVLALGVALWFQHRKQRVT